MLKFLNKLDFYQVDDEEIQNLILRALNDFETPATPSSYGGYQYINEHAYLSHQS